MYQYVAHNITRQVTLLAVYIKNAMPQLRIYHHTQLEVNSALIAIARN